MRKYHELTVAAVDRETDDSVRIRLDVPAELREEFGFLAGQHLPVQVLRDGKPIRRTYSICSAPGEFPLEIGVRIQPGGQFSEYAAGELRPGSHLEVMPPFGRFHADVDPAAGRFHAGFAAGSGITPILSIVRTVLEREPGSRFLLFYGNRSQQTTMFIEDLFALKNRFPDRLQLHFLFSREDHEFEVMRGRLDAKRVESLYRAFCAIGQPDEVYICGPDTMIDTVRQALVGLGVDDQRIRAERFGAPRKVRSERPEPPPSADRLATVDVIMDGHRKTFDMPVGSDNIVDAAAACGIELPYSCKGGVCATCRTHVREGEVRMATNYGLEPWEVEAGFVLACQSLPVTDRITIDYDKT